MVTKLAKVAAATAAVDATVDRRAVAELKGPTLKGNGW